MIDREELIEVLKAVEAKLKTEEITVDTTRYATGLALKRRINVKHLRIALEFGESVSSPVAEGLR